MRVDRRTFVQGSSAALLGGALFGSRSLASAVEDADSMVGRLYKTLKIGMVNVPGTLSDKFAAVKLAGYDGIEMDAPGMNVEATKIAIAESGLPVDGTVCSSHWSIRHSSANADERAKALEDLKTAIRDTHAVGGHTVLLVVGHGNDGTEEEVWERSFENISKAIPLAAELGIYIAFENVWNHFCYDHAGGADQTADKYAKFVDVFNSPWVGMQFDIGNHWKYGDTGNWIRTLGKRIVKLDIKGFSRAENKFTEIAQGDIDYLDVRKALREIGYIGWVAAEVGGGDTETLGRIATEMDQVLRIKS